MTARSERTQRTQQTDAHGRVTPIPVTETENPTPRTKRTTATSAPSTPSTPSTRQRRRGARRTDTSGSTTAGKTQWERMSKSDLTLARLGELLAHEKAAANASQQTLRWYRGTLRRYSEWLASQDLAPTLANFTVELVQRYILDLQQQQKWEYHPYMLPKDKPLSDHSVNSYVRALRGFASWLYAEGYTREHILGRMKAPKTTKIVQDILSVEEIGQIAGALNPRTEIGARDQAIFLVLLDTCMRAGELCGLTLDQLHLEEGYATVLGKGKKMRPVRIGARAAKALRFYLLHWHRPAVPSEQHVFLTCKTVQTERERGLRARPRLVAARSRLWGCRFAAWLLIANCTTAWRATTKQALPHARQRGALGHGEVIEKLCAHHRNMGRFRRAQPGQPVLSEHGVGPPGVARERLAAHQPRLLQPINQAADPALGQHHGFGQRREPHPPLRQIREVQQHLERGERQVVLGLQCGVERIHHLPLHAEHADPHRHKRHF